MADVAEERRTILRLLEEGKITPEQAVELLKALGSPPGAGAAGVTGPGAGAAAGAGTGAGGEAGAEAGRAGPAADAGERGDVLRWVEQVGNRIADMAEELGERIQRTLASGAVGERVGDVGERLAEVSDRLQELGRSVADRIAYAFGQMGTAVLPAFTFTDELTGEFAPGAQPHVELATRHGSIAIHTDPSAERRWRLTIRKHLRGRSREDAEQAAARLLSTSHGPSYLTVRAEGWLQGSADLELTLPAGLTVSLRAETTSGSVTVRGARASSFEARTANGRVDLSDVEAQRVLVRAANGTLLLERVRADLVEASSVNGSITAALAGADVRLSTANGSVTVRPDWHPEGPAHQRLEARTLNGGVRVILPPAARDAAVLEELGLVLEAATAWGSARVDVPGAVMVTQAGQLGRQRVVYQSPHLERVARTLRVEAEAKTGSAAITAD